METIPGYDQWKARTPEHDCESNEYGLCRHCGIDLVTCPDCKCQETEPALTCTEQEDCDCHSKWRKDRRERIRSHVDRFMDNMWNAIASVGGKRE